MAVEVDACAASSAAGRGSIGEDRGHSSFKGRSNRRCRTGYPRGESWQLVVFMQPIGLLWRAEEPNDAKRHNVCAQWKEVYSSQSSY